VFSGNGPILVVTTYPDISDPRVIDKLAHMGIERFLGYEAPLARVREVYGVPYEILAADLDGREDVRVLDFNGHHIFSCFSLEQLGAPFVSSGRAGTGGEPVGD
jgi:hypothetical protein